MLLAHTGAGTPLLLGDPLHHGLEVDLHSPGPTAAATCLALSVLARTFVGCLYASTASGDSRGGQPAAGQASSQVHVIPCATLRRDNGEEPSWLPAATRPAMGACTSAGALPEPFDGHPNTLARTQQRLRGKDGNWSLVSRNCIRFLVAPLVAWTRSLAPCCPSSRAGWRRLGGGTQ